MGVVGNLVRQNGFAEQMRLKKLYLRFLGAYKNKKRQ
jgi:hypothetical protein